MAKTGRRAGLKILWRVTFRVGSSPTPGILQSVFGLDEFKPVSAIRVSSCLEVLGKSVVIPMRVTYFTRKAYRGN